MAYMWSRRQSVNDNVDNNFYLFSFNVLSQEYKYVGMSCY